MNKKHIPHVLAMLLITPLCYAGDIATEKTQAATMAIITFVQKATEEVERVVGQVRDLEKTAGDTLDLALHDLLPVDDLYDLLAEVEGVLEEGNQLAYTADGLNDFMLGQFETYDDYLQSIVDDGGIIKATFENRFKKWNTGHRNAIRQIMTAHGVHAEQVIDSKARLETLQEMSKTAAGRMQAAQVGHKIAVEQVKQITELRTIIMEQSNLHASYFAHKQAMEAEKAAADTYITERRQVVEIDNGKGY